MSIENSRNQPDISIITDIERVVGGDGNELLVFSGLSTSDEATANTKGLIESMFGTSVNVREIQRPQRERKQFVNNFRGEGETEWDRKRKAREVEAQKQKKNAENN